MAARHRTLPSSRTEAVGLCWVWRRKRILPSLSRDARLEGIRIHPPRDPTGLRSSFWAEAVESSAAAHHGCILRFISVVISVHKKNRRFPSRSWAPMSQAQGLNRFRAFHHSPRYHIRATFDKGTVKIPYCI